MSEGRPHLLLLMTPGIGLSTWQRNGSLERELAPYREYVRRGWQVTLATFDRPNEVPSLPPGIDVVFCWHRWLLCLAPCFLRNALRQADVVKTNQSGRAWWYVFAANLAGKPIMLRCGWLPGGRELFPYQPLRRWLYRKKEAWAFRHATVCEVATEADKGFVCRVYGAPLARVFVWPNFVNTSLFRPIPEIVPVARTVVSVGRLDIGKRFALLLEACSRAGAHRLTIAGEGPERRALESAARKFGIELHLPGRVPQAALPELLQQSQVFVLASQVEGHPKALFEAMSCGLPCVVVDAPGLREAGRDARTLVTSPTVEGLAGSLKQLFDSQELRTQTAVRGRTFVTEHLEFSRLMDAEIARVTAIVCHKERGT